MPFYICSESPAEVCSAAGGGGRRKEEKSIIADCVQEALGIFPPIVLCNPYVNSTLC